MTDSGGIVKVHVMSCVVCDDCGIVAAGIDAAEAMMSALRHDKRHTKGDLAHRPTDGRRIPVVNNEQSGGTVDSEKHTHRSGCRELVHTHAWASEPHNHMLRAVCGEPECAGCFTHNIHPKPSQSGRNETDIS
jgi:hypothetical protein